MKINDILLENDNSQIFDKIIQGKFFIEYIKPLFENEINDYIEDYKNEDNVVELKQELVSNLWHELNNALLVHGTNYTNDNAKLIEFKYRDEPKDTHPYFHNYINNKTKEKFNEPIRNLFYAIFSKFEAERYGEINYLFFIDNFKFYYKEKQADFTTDYDTGDIVSYADLYTEVLSELNSDDINKLNNNKIDHKQKIKNILDIVLGYFDNIDNINNIHNITKDDIKTIIKQSPHNKLGNKIPDSIYETIINIVYDSFITLLNEKIENIDSYINDIEEVNDYSKLPYESEIMIKFDEAVLLSDNGLLEFIKYYLNNNLNE